MKTVLNDIISNEQTGFLKGRYIGENVRLILDIIHYCKVKSIHGTLLFLDFEKAFDRLDWGFVQDTLTFFNFGPDFKHWVNTIYGNANSCVTNDGHFSKYFSLSRGVRQGCPLSPYLFIMCAEIFSIMIKGNDIISGITIGDSNIKILLYADDAVIITNGSKESIKELCHVLEKFSKASGLIVNLDKSFIFPMGPFIPIYPKYLDDFKFKITFGPINYLGISFSHHVDDFFRLNYLPKLSRIKRLLNIWSSRDLTPTGKIVILKCFAISQLVYILTILPMPPLSFFKDLDSIFYKFIWNNKPDKIKRTTMINRRIHGGFNMIDMLSFAKSLKTTWVKLYLDDTHRQWKCLFNDSLKRYGGTFIFQCNFSGNDVLHISNIFIRQVCEIWSEYNFYHPIDNFGNQFVLNNSHIKINKNIVYNDCLHKGDAYRVL